MCCLGICVHVCIMLSLIQLFVPLWTVAHKTPLSVGFPRKYWSGLPFPTPEDLSDPGIEPVSLGSHALAGRFFTPFRNMNTLIYKLSQTCCLTDACILAF